MAFGWNPFGAWNLAAAAATLALAVFVYAHAARNRMARRVVMVLALDAVAVAGTGGLVYLATDAASAYAAQAMGAAAGAAGIVAYLALIGQLRTRLAGPLRARGAQVAMLVLAAIVGLVAVLAPALLTSSVAPATYASYDSVGGPGRGLLQLVGIAVFLYATVCSLAAMREARTPEERRHARSYAAAFVVRDILFAIILVAALSGAGGWWRYLPVVGGGLLLVGYVPLLAYGVLRTNLFDIDLKLKWTVRRGTLLAILAGAFVVAAEIAETWISASYGYLVGAIAAAALLLAFHPLDRIARRVADAAMPNVTPTDSYVAYRKMTVYRAALEGTLEDGVISDKEREILARLRRSLDIPEADAAALERELVA